MSDNLYRLLAPCCQSCLLFFISWTEITLDNKEPRNNDTLSIELLVNPFQLASYFLLDSVNTELVEGTTDYFRLITLSHKLKNLTTI